MRDRKVLPVKNFPLWAILALTLAGCYNKTENPENIELILTEGLNKVVPNKYYGPELRSVWVQAINARLKQVHASEAASANKESAEEKTSRIVFFLISRLAEEEESKARTVVEESWKQFQKSNENASRPYWEVEYTAQTWKEVVEKMSPELRKAYWRIFFKKKSE
jgi:hypothetical protein